MIKNFELKDVCLKTEYERLRSERQIYLDKAKEACKYTIPSLITDDNQKNTAVLTYKTPNQSVGADGINNLASKMVLTLLPPNQTFFRFEADPISIKEMAEINGQDPKEYESEINRGLALTEDLLLKYQQQKNDRVCAGEMFKHIFVAGNVFGVFTGKDGLKYYPLSRYVVKRDYIGNVLKAITEETIGYGALPDNVKEVIRQQIFEKEGQDTNNTRLDEKEFTLYTGFYRYKNKWIVFQQVENVLITETIGYYPIEISPFMALRYTRVDGESYGRGLIEEYIGDLSYLDCLSLAIKQSALAGSKVIMLVNPTGITKIKEVVGTPNGGACSGRADDIQFLQVGKYNDLAVANEQADKLEKRLNRIFVMKAAIQREAERVTAEEIRIMANELDETLGNQYSIMCKEFQEAYTKITFYHLRKEKATKLPDLIRDKRYKLTITTGLEALGRNSDLTKLTTFLQVMGQIAPCANGLGMKVETIAKAVAASMNIDVDGYFYSEEEKQQMQQQAQQNALLEKATPNLVNQIGNQMTQQQEGTQE